MKVIKPPKWPEELIDPPAVFLGGSIEMGKAENWQRMLEKELSDVDGTILNPRRDDWDSSWVQDPTPGTKFYEQVTWELDAQDEADIIVYWFSGETKSPITLLELGIYATKKGKRVIVYCDKEFWRYGNVAIVCDEYGVPMFTNKDEFVSVLRAEIEAHNAA